MSDSAKRVSTGVAGLDEILRGGLITRRAYLIRGGPGSGKTILGLHFLRCALAAGEPALFITFGESAGEIRQNADLMGFDLNGLAFIDFSPPSDHFAEDGYDIFPPSEVEREPVTRRIKDEVGTLRPTRIFVDGMTQFRYLTSGPFHFRKEALSFLRYLCELDATVLFTSESNETPDEDLQFMADGVIQLDFRSGERSVQVIKYRGSDFRAGPHSMRIFNHGLEVFPRLVPEEFSISFEPEQIPFGIPELDRMTHGGLERGTISLITGPSGVGKTTLGMQFMKEAAARGERSVVYLFEEWTESLYRRCEAIHIPVRAMTAQGKLSVVHVEPLRFTADQFALMVRREVELNKTRIVMIDSVAGYRLSLRDEELVTHLHALAKYLQNMGVAVLLINEVEGITGDFRITDVGVSYMVDNIVFLRYLEIRGKLAKALGVLKKRLSDFEKTVREVSITPEGIKVGPELTNLRGILTGSPEFLEVEP